MFLEQLALTADIASVTLGRHILANGLHRLAGDDLGADGGLNRYIELLARNQFLELLAHLAADIIGMIDVSQRRQRIDRLAVEQNVELRELAGLISRLVVVERRIAARYALELVVKIEHDFGQRHIEIDLDAVLRDIYLIEQRASLVDAQFDDIA